MVASAVLLAKRALLKLVLALAVSYADAVAKRPVLSKVAYIQKVRRVLKTKKAQTTASNRAMRLRKACQMVVKGDGVAVKG